MAGSLSVKEHFLTKTGCSIHPHCTRFADMSERIRTGPRNQRPEGIESASLSVGTIFARVAQKAEAFSLSLNKYRFESCGGYAS